MARKSKAGIAPDRPKSTAFTEFYRADALSALPGGLHAAYAKRGRAAAEADIVFERLTANLRVLRQIHAAAGRILAGDAQARVELRANLDGLASRYPAFRGAAARLVKRVASGKSSGGGGSAPDAGVLHARSPGFGMGAGGQAGMGCGLISRAGMIPVYAGVAAAYGYDRDGWTSGLDVVAGLSGGHGALESLNHAFERDGVAGVDRAIEWGESTGDPTYGFSTGKGGGGLPDLGDPRGGDPEWDSTGRGLGGSGLRIPGEDFRPPIDRCELVRQACEALLLDTLTNGPSDMPASQRPAVPGAWAHNIERIEFPGGRCAGQKMIIHGHDFGTPSVVRIGGRAVPNTAVVMMVGGECTGIHVLNPERWTNAQGDIIPGPVGERMLWTDTRIEVKLPAHVTEGPVGFYSPSAIAMYNLWTSNANSSAGDIMTASRCLGTPMTMPALTAPVEIFQPFLGVPCPPATKYNVIAAGPPIIRSFTARAGAQFGREILIDPADEIGLAWSVINADHVAVRRVSTAGPALPGGVDRLDDPPGSSVSLGVSGHDISINFVYQLIATNANGCGDATEEVIFHASKRPRLTIDDIEVTHGIQTRTNSVKLIAGKPTVVRVYAGHGVENFNGTNTVSGVTGRLRVLRQWDGSWSPWLFPINSGSASPPAITLPKTVNRMQTDDTLNFQIPTDLCTAMVSFEVEISVDNFAAPAGTTIGFSEKVDKRFDGFTFHPGLGIALKFAPVTIVPDPNGVFNVQPGISNPPTDDECRRFLTRTMQHIPTNADSISKLENFAITLRMDSITIDLPGGGRIQRAISFDIGGNILLEVMTFLHQQVDDTSIWAILVPTSPGPWGRAHIPGNDYICWIGTGASDEASSAHELAHCLSQEHIGLRCGNGDRASGGDTPEEWGEDGGRVVDVPFDVARNSAVSGSVFDLMTYCQPKWSSPQRWQRILDYLGGR